MPSFLWRWLADLLLSAQRLQLHHISVSPLSLSHDSRSNHLSCSEWHFIHPFQENLENVFNVPTRKRQLCWTDIIHLCPMDFQTNASKAPPMSRWCWVHVLWTNILTRCTPSLHPVSLWIEKLTETWPILFQGSSHCLMVALGQICRSPL